jgi:polyhydroxybutyrate depolymerase
VKWCLVPLLLLSSSPLFSDCDPSPAVRGNDVTLTFEHDSVERSFVLHLPTGYDCKTRLPLLMGVHGYGGSGKFWENEWAGIFDHINEHNYIGLFPDGMHPSPQHPENRGFNDLGSRHDDGPDGLTCKPPPFDYPVFDNCPESDRERVCSWGNSCADDLGFFRALITHVSQTWSVDPQRIYMAGYSQGGSTINGLAPHLADLLAAVAPMHGFQANGYAHAPEAKLPFLQVWGTTDQTVPGTGLPASDGLIYESGEETAAIWAAAQGCSEDGSTRWPSSADGKQGWRCSHHADCRGGSEVVSCQWDGGHTWPRAGDDNFGWDVIWSFFRQHHK